ncbi:MAG: sugar transferase [Chloroflexi bacterium]|nr:sugar transferase [Chloroflexota bacterium]MCL5074257.1 sugar transferase [Chloroflexota bacterium]
MLSKYGIRFVTFVFLADLLLTELSLFVAEYARRKIDLGLEIHPTVILLNPYIYIVVGLIWIFIFMAFSAYDFRRVADPINELQTVIAAVGTAVLVFAGYLYLSFRDVPRLLFVYFFIFDMFLLLSYRLVVRLILYLLNRYPNNRRRVLIAGAGHQGQEVLHRLNECRSLGLEVTGFVDDEAEKGKAVGGSPVYGGLDDITKVINELAIDEVIFALPAAAHQKIVQLAFELESYPVTVRVVPDLFALVTKRATLDDFFGIPLIGVQIPGIDGFNMVFKRLFDVVVAGIGLLFLSPLMLLASIAILLDSGWPVIFTQERVGLNGRLFHMYKFRTMIRGAEQKLHEIVQATDDEQPVFKVRDDPRVTRLGRFLRRTSLDELPQLFNVLKGEMSLVGPRPEQPFIVAQYEAWQRKRLSVLPGITGWWQVNGRSDKPMHLNTEYDLYYIQNYSLFLDLLILWKTAWVVLKGKGAF